MPQTTITIKERHEFARTAKASALARIMQSLAVYASEHGGRFLLFGSGARNELRHDSDFDFLVDFPQDLERSAISFLEDLCTEAGQIYDVLSIRSRGPEFLQRVMQEARVAA